jgi:hypothetical protein
MTKIVPEYSHLRWAEAAVGVGVRVGRRLRGDAAGAAAVGHVHLGHLLVRVVVVVVVVVADRVVVVVRNDRLATLRRNLTGQRVEGVEHFHRDTCLLRFVQLLGGWMRGSNFLLGLIVISPPIRHNTVRRSLYIQYISKH